MKAIGQIADRARVSLAREVDEPLDVAELGGEARAADREHDTEPQERTDIHALEGRLDVLVDSVARHPGGGEEPDVHAARGQAVEPSYTAFTIADRSTLWVRLSVFEGEVVNIRVGDSVEISSQVTPDEVLTGTVTFVSTVLDPVTRSAEVRVVVPNEAGKLRVGQAVNARIRPSAARKQALAIPRKAMVQVDGKPTVFVEVGERAVMPRTIEIGAQGPDLVEVKKGLEPGERIVTEGVFALKSELFR